MSTMDCEVSRDLAQKRNQHPSHWTFWWGKKRSGPCHFINVLWFKERNALGMTKIFFSVYDILIWTEKGFWLFSQFFFFFFHFFLSHRITKEWKRFLLFCLLFHCKVIKLLTPAWSFFHSAILIESIIFGISIFRGFEQAKFHIFTLHERKIIN